MCLERQTLDSLSDISPIRYNVNRTEADLGDLGAIKEIIANMMVFAG
jgi:hypothetical protein